MSLEFITESGKIEEILKDQNVRVTSGAIRDRQIGEKQWASVVSCVKKTELPAIFVGPDGVETNRVQEVAGDLILARD